MSAKPSFNTNPAHSANFLLSFDRIPGVAFSCQRVTIPGLQINHVPIAIPSHNPMWRPGDIVQFNAFQATFTVNEDFTNWIELQRWMRSITPVEGPEALNTYIKENGTSHSDAVVSITDNGNKPFLAVYFNYCLPYSMGDLVMSTTDSTAQEVLCDMTFVYSHYSVEVKGKKVV